MGRNVSVDDLADAIIDELFAFDAEVFDRLRENIMDVAEITRKQIQTDSPKLTGDYGKGWKVKKAYESKTDIRVTVCNPKEYPLTHLLEKGHVVVNAKGQVIGTAPAYPHIEPAEKKAEELLGKRVNVIVKGK